MVFSKAEGMREKGKGQGVPEPHARVATVPLPTICVKSHEGYILLIVD